MRIAIPESLVKYVKIRDNEIHIKQEIPAELNDIFNKFKTEFKESYEKFKNCK